MSRSSLLLLITFAVTAIIFFFCVLSYVAEFERCSAETEFRCRRSLPLNPADDRRFVVASVRYTDGGEQQRGQRYIRLTTVDRVGGGVGRVDPGRTEKRGYARQLVTYKRRALIVADDDSTANSESSHERNLRELLRRASDDQAPLLRKCKLVNGDEDCRDRRSDVTAIKCTHLRDDVLDETKTRVLISRNRSRFWGWCLPTRLHTLSNRRNCNPLTGNWILAAAVDDQDEATAAANIDGLARLICKCRYPNLMTQTSPEGDCDQPVGCRGGRLDHLSVAGLVDPYVNGRCVCDSTDTYASYDVTIGPICARRKVHESSGELRRFVGRGSSSSSPSVDEDDATTVPLLSIEKVSRQFLDIWRAGGGDQDLRLPDPCRLDTRTGGVIVDVAASCRSVYDQQLRAVVCRPSLASYVTGSSGGQTYVPIKVSTDYLLNNHGRHDNACASELSLVDRRTDNVVVHA